LSGFLSGFPEDFFLVGYFYIQAKEIHSTLKDGLEKN